MNKKNLTPLQELIETYKRKLSFLNKIRLSKDGNKDEEKRIDVRIGDVRSFITDLERQLPAEREAIEQAYRCGWVECPAKSKTKITEEQEMYFTDTYQ